MERNKQDTYELLWIRHGLSNGNKDPAAYAEDGDPQVELDDEGWRQSIAAGKFLKKYLHGKGDDEWPLIFVGEFKRHEQTLAGIMHGMGRDAFPDNPQINPDSRLNEQSFGVLPYMASEEGEHEALSLKYSRKVRGGNAYSARPTHGESRRDAESHVKSLIDGTLQRDMVEGGHKRIILITSGAVINAATKSWFHLPMNAWDNGDLKNPDNCDIRSFMGASKDWSVTKIYDGPSAQKCSENVIEGIERLSVETLPEVPEHILDNIDLGRNEL